MSQGTGPLELAVEFARKCEELLELAEEDRFYLARAAWQVAVYLEAADAEVDVVKRARFYRISSAYLREAFYYFRAGTRGRKHPRFAIVMSRLGAAVAILCSASIECSSGDSETQH